SSLRRFENMVMTSLSVPRNAQTGAALRFSATFQQVVFVTNNRTTVRVAVPQARKPVNLGNLQNQQCFVNKVWVDPKHHVWFDDTSWWQTANPLPPPDVNTWQIVRSKKITKRPAAKDTILVTFKMAK